MGLFDFLLVKKQTASVAKDRLRIIIAQAVLGDGSGVLLDLQEIEQSHAQPPKSLLKKPFFSVWVKRIGRVSPSSRATASS